jgi:DNA-binding FadR family transcriptional regulator
VLHRCFAAIHSVLHSVHWRLLKRKVSLDAAGMRRLNLEHRAVLAAIQAGNPRQARSVMARHLVDLRDVLF